MLTVHPPGAISKCLGYLGYNTLHDASPCKITNVNSLTSIAICPSPFQAPCNNVVRNSSFPWKGRDQLDIYQLSHGVPSKKWLVSSGVFGLKCLLSCLVDFNLVDPFMNPIISDVTVSIT